VAYPRCSALEASWARAGAGVGLGGRMAENEPTLPKHPETAPRKPLSRRWIGGPLLVAGLVMAGMFGWEAWNHHQFEKERTETPPLVIPDLKLKLLWIPAGTFTMGTEDEAEWVKSVKKRYNDVKPSGWAEWKLKEVEKNETPATVVTLTKGFYLGETEVTQAQWESIMGNNPSEFKGPNLPVSDVDWNECVLFCQKLTQRERAAGRLGPKQVYRLPTDAEWEYACRAGSTGDFCFGNDQSRLGEFAWIGPGSVGVTHDVGTKKANGWGLYDIHGNVWEWCSDCYGAYWSGGTYSGGFVSDPTGTGTGPFRATRGGSRSASHYGLPYSARRNLGLRLAAGQEP
jgi:formylglycine-generating enzyme required for sulfatase activity